MKKITTIPILACIAIAATVSSCKKDKNTTPTPTPTPTPTSNTPTINTGSVDGALISLVTESTTVTMGIPVTVSTETAVASFYSVTGTGGTMIDGGTVSVNTYALDKQTNNSYTKVASIGMSPSSLNFSSNSSNWSVGGAGSVPAFTHNDNASFPDYTGTLDSVVTRSSGITVSLSGKVSNADSVILFIAAGSTYVSRTVAGSASSVTLSASDLASLPAVSDKTAILEVVPYRYTVQNKGGKNYAFIKEFAATKSINIQ